MTELPRECLAAAFAERCQEWRRCAAWRSGGFAGFGLPGCLVALARSGGGGGRQSIAAAALREMRVAGGGCGGGWADLGWSRLGGFERRRSWCFGTGSCGSLVRWWLIELFRVGVSSNHFFIPFAELKTSRYTHLKLCQLRRAKSSFQYWGARRTFYFGFQRWEPAVSDCQH